MRPVFSSRGLRNERKLRFHITGEIKNTGGQAALTTDIEELIDAYSNDFQDFGLYDNSGNLTPHHILNSDPRNISGNRVLWRSWDGLDPAEYVNCRRYGIIVEATLEALESNLVSYHETVTTIGDGSAEYAAVNTQNGPRADLLYPSTWIRVIQHGHAVYYSGYGGAAFPLFPANIHTLQSYVKVGDPRFRGQGYTYYPISWHYEMSITTPGIYAPNIP